MIEYPCQLRKCVHCKKHDENDAVTVILPCVMCSEFVGFSLFREKVIDEILKSAIEPSAVSIGKPDNGHSPVCSICGFVAKTYAGRMSHEAIKHGKAKGD